MNEIHNISNIIALTVAKCAKDTKTMPKSKGEKILMFILTPSNRNYTSVPRDNTQS